MKKLLILLILGSILAAGCSTAQSPKVALTAVLNRMFERPDEETSELIKGSFTFIGLGVEKDDARNAKVQENSKKLVEQLTNDIGQYFTERGFEQFVNDYRNNYQFVAMVKDIEFTISDVKAVKDQNTKDRVDFSATISYTDSDGNTESFLATGRGYFEGDKIYLLKFDEKGEFESVINALPNKVELW